MSKGLSLFTSQCMMICVDTYHSYFAAFHSETCLSLKQKHLHAMTKDANKRSKGFSLFRRRWWFVSILTDLFCLTAVFSLPSCIGFWISNIVLQLDQRCRCSSSNSTTRTGSVIQKNDVPVKNLRSWTLDSWNRQNRYL